MEDLALLLIRAVIGLLLIGHGTAKLLGWFAGPGFTGTSEYLESLGYPRGRLMAAVAGLTETGAGAALVAGAFTPLAAAAVIGTMINAAVSEHRHAGLWAERDGYEYPLVLAVLAVGFALAGPGALSVDGTLGWDLTGPYWAAGAVGLGAIVALLVLATRQTASSDQATHVGNGHPAA